MSAPKPAPLDRVGNPRAVGGREDSLPLIGQETRSVQASASPVECVGRRRGPPRGPADRRPRSAPLSSAPVSTPLTRREILKGAAVGVGALGAGAGLAAAAAGAKRERVAVVGAGAGGVAAAYFLAGNYDVEVFEAR